MRPRAATGAVILALSTAAPADARHSPCEWGARASVDPFGPQPLQYGVGGSFWECSGPHVRAGVTAGGREIVVHASRDGARWTAHEPDEADSHADEAPGGAAGPWPDEPRLHLHLVAPRAGRVGVTLRLRLHAAWVGGGSEPVEAAGVHLLAAGRRAVTRDDGRATLRLVPRRQGALRPVARADGTSVPLGRVKVLPRRARHR